jgi:hypothetical protein
MKQTLFTAAAVMASVCQAAPHGDISVVKRDSNYTSSCGDNWMARDDVKTNNGEISRRGYLNAVASFCKEADGKTVGGGDFLSMATRVFLDGGGDPTSSGTNGYVFFEVHNNQKSDSHTVNCKQLSRYDPGPG